MSQYIYLIYLVLNVFCSLSPGCSLVGLILKLKLQYFGHLIQRVDSFEKTLMLGKIEGRRKRGWQRMRWLRIASPTQWTWVWVDFGSWWWTGRPGVLWFMGLQRVGHDWVTELKTYFHHQLFASLSFKAPTDCIKPINSWTLLIELFFQYVIVSSEVAVSHMMYHSLICLKLQVLKSVFKLPL